MPYTRVAGSVTGDFGYLDAPDGLDALFNGVLGCDESPDHSKLYVCDFGNSAIRVVGLDDPLHPVSTLVIFSDVLETNHPRWISVGRETGMLWVTCTNLAYSYSTIFSVDPNTAEVVNWGDVGPGDGLANGVAGSIMAGLCGPLDRTPGGSAQAGPIYRAKHYPRWAQVTYYPPNYGGSGDPEAFVHEQWHGDPGCAPGSTWTILADGAFPDSDVGMAWCHDQSDGMDAYLAVDYVYPSGNGNYLMGPTFGEPHCFNLAVGPCDPVRLPCFFRSVYSAGNPCFPGTPTDGTVERIVTRGPQGYGADLGGFFMAAPRFSNVNGGIHLAYYDNTGLDPLRNSTLGDTAPAVGLTWSQGMYYLTFQLDLLPFDQSGFNSGYPVNTIHSLEDPTWPIGGFSATSFTVCPPDEVPSGYHCTGST